MTFSYKSYYNYVVMIYYELPIFIVCRMYIFIVLANNKGVIHDYFIFGITIDTLFLMLLRHFSQCQYKILLITQIFKCKSKSISWNIPWIEMLLSNKIENKHM